MTGDFCGDSGVGSWPETSCSSDVVTADQRSPPDSTAHGMEGGRPTLCYTLSAKRKSSIAIQDMSEAILDDGHMKVEGINAIGVQRHRRPELTRSHQRWLHG